MCGIAGLIHFKNNSTDDLHYLQWCIKTMHHRGPDSNGIWTNNENYSTAFVRLAIRDLTEHGNQPMHSACGRYVITFNGELYNTNDFTPDLIKDGIKFRSSSDTEVLLYSLIKWGENILTKINGIFAFAFFDKQEKTLLLARDRVGIKPLYYGLNANGLVYSSQYNHVINHPYFKNNSFLNSAVNSYFSFGYVAEGEGLIAETFLLPHGHYLKIKNNNCEQKKYYQYPVELSETSNFNLEQIIDKCVKQQLVSDVPVGTFMSGGVDSTLVTASASKNTTIKSFTIGVDDKHLDESNEAKEFANYFNTEHFNRHVQPSQLIKAIEDNSKAFNEPFADFSSIPTLLISEFARKQVTVALSGDGGDELFWGYPRNYNVLHTNHFLKQSTSTKLLQFVQERISTKSKTISKRHLQVKDIVEFYYQRLFIAGSAANAKKILQNYNYPTPFFLKQTQNSNINIHNNISVMNAIRKLEMDLHLQRILIKVDRASMYHSLEVRVPLLDNDMLDYSNSINYTECINEKVGKLNLKNLLAKKTNPVLVFKPKKGFDIPMGQWLREAITKDVQEKIFAMPNSIEPFFNSKGLEKIFKQHLSKEQDHTWLLWATYSFVNWYNHHYNKY